MDNDNSQNNQKYFTPQTLKQSIHTFIEVESKPESIHHPSRTTQAQSLNQGKLSKQRVRSLSFEERTCSFSHLTNLHSVFNRSKQYKREGDFEMLENIITAKQILENRQTPEIPLPYFIEITVKQLTQISADFLVTNTLELKTGECKRLLDSLLDCEKVFKKAIHSVYNIEQARDADHHRMDSDQSSPGSVRSQTGALSSSINSSFSKSISHLNHRYSAQTMPSTQFHITTTLSPSHSSCCSPSTHNLRFTSSTITTTAAAAAAVTTTQHKSKFFLAEQNQIDSCESTSRRISNQIPFIEDSVNFSNILTNNQSNYNQMMVESLPIQTFDLPDNQQYQQQQQQLKQHQNQLCQIQQQIPMRVQQNIKRLLTSLRFTLTKVGILLHYMKMQNYFYRDEELVKSLHHPKHMRSLHLKRPSSIFPVPCTYDSHLLIEEPNQSCCSTPKSSFSPMGGLSPQNQPQSQNLHHSTSKDDSFNLRVYYQKVNEDNDASDENYSNLIFALRQFHKLQKDDQNILSKSGRMLFYSLKERILDSHPSLLKKRQFLLGRFLIWKAKRWFTLHKRQQMENKKLSFMIHSSKQVCRICDSNVLLKDFKEHSQFCKELEDARKEIKLNLTTINSEMFYFLQKSRTFGVKCKLLQKRIERQSRSTTAEYSQKYATSSLTQSASAAAAQTFLPYITKQQNKSQFVGYQINTAHDDLHFSEKSSNDLLTIEPFKSASVTHIPNLDSNQSKQSSASPKKTQTQITVTTTTTAIGRKEEDAADKPSSRQLAAPPLTKRFFNFSPQSTTQLNRNLDSDENQEEGSHSHLKQLASSKYCPSTPQIENLEMPKLKQRIHAIKEIQEQQQSTIDIMKDSLSEFTAKYEHEQSSEQRTQPSQIAYKTSFPEIPQSSTEAINIPEKSSIEQLLILPPAQESVPPEPERFPLNLVPPNIPLLTFSQVSKKYIKSEMQEKFNLLEKSLKEVEMNQSIDRILGDGTPSRKDSFKKSVPNQIRLELSRLTTIEAASSAASSPFKVPAATATATATGMTPTHLTSDTSTDQPTGTTACKSFFQQVQQYNNNNNNETNVKPKKQSLSSKQLACPNSSSSSSSSISSPASEGRSSSPSVRTPNSNSNCDFNSQFSSNPVSPALTPYIAKMNLLQKQHSLPATKDGINKVAEFSKRYSPALSNTKDPLMVQEVQQLSKNFDLKLLQYKLRTNHISLRISEIIQHLSKVFFIQDISNNWKRKRIILEENKQKIEFLQQKQKIPKEYSHQITNILKIFSNRVDILERIDNLEKQIKLQFEEAMHQSAFNEESQLEIHSMKQSDDPFVESSSSNKVSFSAAGSSFKQQQIQHRSSMKTSHQKLSPVILADYQKSMNISSTSMSQQYSLQLQQLQSTSRQSVSFSLNRLTPGESSDNTSEVEVIQSQDDDSQKSECSLQIQENSENDSEHTYEDNFGGISDAYAKRRKTVETSQLFRNSPTRTNPRNKRSKYAMNAGKKSEIASSQCFKFEEIMKNARKKVEDQLLQSNKFSSFHDGYFSDGTIPNCYKGLEKLMMEQKEHVEINDFEFVKLISKGAFGRVWLVKKKKTDNFYAMKIINLAEKVNKNTLASLQNEKDILKIVSGDFVVKAIQSFSHESYLCFVMEYMVGGDLGGIINQYGVLAQTIARFYIAEIILACSQLHSAGIVHRDLKPDNLLLDSKGHLKLTDFGLSDMGMKSRNMESGKLQMKKARQDVDNLRRGMEKLRSIKGAEKIFSATTPSTKSEKNRELIQMKTNLDVILKRKKTIEVSETGSIATTATDPSNMMIDSSTLNSSQSHQKKPEIKHRIIGTPDYIPPEVIQGTSNLNSPTLDWWSVGVILFEMLVGIPPFNDETVEQIFDNIVNMRVPWDQISIGYGEDQVTPEAEDLIKKLMDFNPQTRLGVNGVTEIQTHSFFSGFDWENVHKLTAPVIPKVKNILDTSNFDKDIKFSDKEVIDPFFGLAKPTEEISQAKDILKGYNFQMKRYDILYEENCQQLEEIEKKMKSMEEEIIKDEEELEKLEVEYGQESNEDEEDQTFNFPRSVVTFQDIDSIQSSTLIPALQTSISSSSANNPSPIDPIPKPHPVEQLNSPILFNNTPPLAKENTITTEPLLTTQPNQL